MGAGAAGEGQEDLPGEAEDEDGEGGEGAEGHFEVRREDVEGKGG